MKTPILYTFRRCPYAIRARIALRYAQINVIPVEVDLRNKPLALLQASSKATVPVLVVNEQLILSESMDIMYWALTSNDPDDWLNAKTKEQTRALIQYNDCYFKLILDAYKYNQNREPQHLALYRDKAHPYLNQLNDLLQENIYLLGPKVGLLDSALVPFIRQFYMVDKHWFEQSKYQHLQRWLANFLASDLFMAVMAKTDNLPTALSNSKSGK